MRERLYMRPRLVVEPRDGELRAAIAEHARTAVCDAPIVRDTDHEAFAFRQEIF
jgi:hypothetical protein